MSVESKVRLDYLLKKYSHDTITESEAIELSNFLSQPAFEKDIRNILEALSYETEPMQSDSARWDKMIGDIFETQSVKTKVISTKSSNLFVRISVAAAILAFVMIGVYFFSAKQKIPSNAFQKIENQKQDVAPGVNKAMLTLADGSTIILDSIADLKASQLALRKGFKIEDGQLLYNKGNNDDESLIKYNTVSTPRGGQYQIVLADGSKVWLNAASSLRFPTSFSGKNRKVELTGEAYFEVAHNKNIPFLVTVKGIEVLVLGTHFNINSYDDEEVVKTTLLEGSVRETIEDKSQSVLIEPGQQVQVGKGKIVSVLNNVDVTQVTAWQKGLFEFNNSDLPTIMRQISRWYDVEIIYQGKIGDARFGGGISKSLPLSEVLKLLKANGVNFQLNGRTLKVIP